MAKIYTTLKEIKLFSPCISGLRTLIKSIGTDYPEDAPIDYLTILESNGVEDTIWCMRCRWFEYKEVWMQFVEGCVTRANKYSAFDAAYAAYTSAYAAYAADSAAYAAYAAYTSAYAAFSAERILQKEHLIKLLS